MLTKDERARSGRTEPGKITRATVTRVSAAAIVAAISGAFTAQAQTHPEKPTFKYEKCYGIAKAGQNHCFTATNSCGGTSKLDNDPKAWVYIEAGTCTGKGGSLKAGGNA